MSARCVRGVALYAAAPAAEWLDRPLFTLTGMLSGHTLKQGLSALAVYWALRVLHRRRPVSDEERSPAH